LLNGAIQILFDNGAVSQVTFSLFGLFGENVAMVSVMSLDFAGAGKGESLLGSGLCFDFGHF
jgi:hypothetical protein